MIPRCFPSAITLQWSWDFWYWNELENYLPGISSVYFAAVGVVGGLYVCNPSSLKVDILLKINLELICTNAVKLPVYTSSN